MGKKYTFPVPGCGQCRTIKEWAAASLKPGTAPGSRERNRNGSVGRTRYPRSPNGAPSVSTRRSAAYTVSRMSGQRMWISIGE